MSDELDPALQEALALLRDEGSGAVDDGPADALSEGPGGVDLDQLPPTISMAATMDVTADLPMPGRPAFVVPEDHPLPLAAIAVDAIDRLMEIGHNLVCAFSSGKDSSVIVNLALSAAAERVRLGKAVPKILIIHSDTGVENPEVRGLADAELDKMRRFAKLHGFEIATRVGKPLLYSSWPVRVIGGRALPSFPTSTRDCSVDLKCRVGSRLQNAVFSELRASPDKPQPVLMTGVRLDESTVRAAGIVSRGETDTEIWDDGEGRLRLSPIIAWSTDEVWEYLGYCAGGLIESYSKFEETMQFYRDAGGSSCAVVGDMKLAADVAKEKGGCGARSGCWTCVRIQKDKSLQQMIESDFDRYGYMRGLNKLRDFISETQYDWDRRTYLGRSIDENGDVAIQADVYSPAMLEELLRYTLTLQARERVAAARKGIPPRFNIIGVREIFAIDALWSLYGLHQPFHALHIMNEVDRGMLSDVPSVDPIKRLPVPRYGKLHIGSTWESDRMTGDPKRDRMLSGGIRSHMHEMVAESCGIGIRRTSKGDIVTEWDTADSFEVDEEGACDFLSFFADELIEKHHNDSADRTIAAMTYLQYGFLQPAHASLMRWNDIARRTQWMQRHGLVGDVSRDKLIQMIAEQVEGEDPFTADAYGRRDAATTAAMDPADEESAANAAGERPVLGLGGDEELAHLRQLQALLRTERSDPVTIDADGFASIPASDLELKRDVGGQVFRFEPVQSSLWGDIDIVAPVAPDDELPPRDEGLRSRLAA